MSAKHPNHIPALAGIPNTAFPLKRVVSVLLAVAALFAASAIFMPNSATAKDAIGLGEVETKQVVRVQKYLNAISTMRAKFLQITSQGQYAQGEFLMSRPGRMRIDCDLPTPVWIVSIGTIVMYKDEELDQRSYVPLGSMPASIFIGNTVDFFSDDLLITDYENSAGVIRITVQRSDDPAEGSLTLVLTAQPLALKKWVVVDAQNISTTVSLMGPEFGVPLNESLFKVENQPMKKRDN